MSQNVTKQQSAPQNDLFQTLFIENGVHFFRGYDKNTVNKLLNYTHYITHSSCYKTI